MVGTGKTFALDAVGAWAIEHGLFFRGCAGGRFWGQGAMPSPAIRHGGKDSRMALRHPAVAG